MRPDDAALAWDGRFLETLEGEERSIEINALLAIRLEALDDCLEVLRAAMAVQFGALDDYRAEHRVQARIDSEQILARAEEQFDVRRLCKIKAAAEAREDQSKGEDVREFVVMADGVFPRGVARQINQARDLLPLLGHVRAGDGVSAGI